MELNEQDPLEETSGEILPPDLVKKKVKENNKMLEEQKRRKTDRKKRIRKRQESVILKWYLQQRLVVTNIQQIVEYKPNVCFKQFGEKVTLARREGDKNTDSII